MQFGVRVHDYGRETILNMVDKLVQANVKNAQLAIPRAVEGIASYDEINQELCEEIYNAYKNHEIRIAVLSCYQDLSNPDTETREKAVSTFIKCLEFNKIVKADVVGTETSYEHLTKFEKQKRFPFMMDSLKRITEEAEKKCVDFAIEPVSFHPLCDVDTTCEVLDVLSSDRVKVIFDLANVLELPNEIQQEAYFTRCFNMLGERIAAIHLKDFYLDAEGNYMPTALGKGCMNYKALISYIKKYPNVPVIREELELKNEIWDRQYMLSLEDV